MLMLQPVTDDGYETAGAASDSVPSAFGGEFYYEMVVLSRVGSMLCEFAAGVVSDLKYGKNASRSIPEIIMTTPRIWEIVRERNS